MNYTTRTTWMTHMQTQINNGLRIDSIKLFLNTNTQSKPEKGFMLQTTALKTFFLFGSGLSRPYLRLQ